MSAATPEDVANVIKLLERLRTGEMNLIPSLATAEPRDPNGKSEAMLRRVEAVLSAHLRRMQEPLGDGGPVHPVRLPIPGAIHANDTPVPTELHTGISLRDHFATAALEAQIVKLNGCSLFDEGGCTYAKLALESYLVADAMLRARSAS